MRLPSIAGGPINGLRAGSKVGFHLLADGATRSSVLERTNGAAIFVERAALVNHLRLEAHRLHGERYA